MYRHSRYLSFFVLLISFQTAFAENHLLTEPVTLSSALELAMRNDPQLKTFVYRKEAAEGQIEQADLRPTPTLSAEVENILGSGSFSSLNGMEVTLGVSQLFESADKQAKRTQLATTNRDHLLVQRDLRLVELHRKVRNAFVKVLIAEGYLKLEQDKLELAQKFHKETERLVAAALSNEAESQRAYLAIKLQEFETLKASLARSQTKGELANIWGQYDLVDFEVEGSVELEAELPDFDQLLAKLSKTPALSQFESVKRIQEAKLEVEESESTGDLEVFAGARYARESGGNAGLVLGVEVPWPTAKLNQGNIRSAKAEIARVDAQRDAAYFELIQKLSLAYQQLGMAHKEATLINIELVPESQKTTQSIQDGYDKNLYTRLEVFDSQNSEFQIRAAYLDAIERYLTAYSEIRILTLTDQ